VNLLTLLVEYVPELEKFEEELDEISNFGVEIRYPDVYYEPSLEEAKTSFDIALMIKRIILNKIEI